MCLGPTTPGQQQRVFSVKQAALLIGTLSGGVTVHTLFYALQVLGVIEAILGVHPTRYPWNDVLPACHVC